MDKYASMWKADTPVERQAEAREMWDDLTGVNHKKEDTSSRLSKLFPQATTHTKEASLSEADLRKRYIAGAALAGSGALGLREYLRSKKNEAGHSAREIDVEARKAAIAKRIAMGQAASRGMLGSASDRLDAVLDEHPGLALAGGALVGGTAAGLGAHHALKHIRDSI